MLKDMMDKEKPFEDVMEKLKQFENVMGKIKSQKLNAISTTKDVVKNEKQEVSLETQSGEWKTVPIKKEGESMGCFLAILVIFLGPIVYSIVMQLTPVLGLLIIILTLILIYKILKSFL